MIGKKSTFDTSVAMNVDDPTTNTRNAENPNIIKYFETSHKGSLKNYDMVKNSRQSSHRDIVVDKIIPRLLSDIRIGKGIPDDAPNVLTSKKDTDLNVSEPKHAVTGEISEKEDVDKNIIDIDDRESDDGPISKRQAPRMSKRLRDMKEITTI